LHQKKNSKTHRQGLVLGLSDAEGYLRLESVDPAMNRAATIYNGITALRDCGVAKLACFTRPLVSKVTGNVNVETVISREFQDEAAHLGVLMVAEY
jgi:hypothetical protein